MNWLLRKLLLFKPIPESSLASDDDVRLFIAKEAFRTGSPVVGVIREDNMLELTYPNGKRRGFLDKNGNFTEF
jgi:hypothetical protein